MRKYLKINGIGTLSGQEVLRQPVLFHEQIIQCFFVNKHFFTYFFLSVLANDERPNLVKVLSEMNHDNIMIICSFVQ